MKTKLLLMPVIFSLASFTVSAQSWSLTGNSGTNTSTNFLGTTDKKGLVLRTNNIERLRITQAGNVGIGTSNPLQKLDVNGNINITADSGFYINNIKVFHTKANQNIFVGGYAGINNLGSSNTATGYNALSGNAGNNNIGSNNAAIGYNALFSNTTGTFNIALGSAALYYNTTGNSNIALGSFALYDNTNGFSNIAIGDNALTHLVEGSENTAVGAAAMYGYFGYQNVAIGANALYSVNGGTDGNTACGYNTLYTNSLGSGHNTAVGINALYNNEGGYLLTAVGSYTDVNDVGYTNSTALGNAALITADNQVRIGNSTIASIGGYKGWTKISDGRIKTNIKDNIPGLAFINKLKPVTYNLNLDAADKIMQGPVIKTKDGKAIQPNEKELEARKAEEKIIYSGFIAQDVEKAAKELNYDFSGVDVAKNNKDLYGLRYEEFVVPLVKAVQELSANNDALQDENKQLEKRIKKLETLLNAQFSNSLSQPLENLNANTLQVKISPNPVHSILNIDFNKSSADEETINIYDVNGRLLITQPANSKTQINVKQLTVGTYLIQINDASGKLLYTSKVIKQ